MKFIFSQMAFFFAEQSNRRNIRFMLRFTVFVMLLVLLYSFLFHVIMQREGQAFSPVTGFYWTLTVMSTLGFGDITFHSDLGKLFSVVVLLSGIILFMLLLPFTFIRFVYTPWLEAQSNALTPRELPRSTSGHIIIVGADSIALCIADRFRQYGIDYVMLIDDADQALVLYDKGYSVVVGELDAIESYQAVRTEKARMVVALHDDLKNTNIAATVREYTADVPITASAGHRDSVDILKLAGCEHVFIFPHMLGQALARRVFSTKLESNIIGRFEGFCVAESPVHDTPLIGKSLAGSNLRGRFGLNAVGIWQGNQFMPARPDTIIDEGAILLLAGTADDLDKYDRSLMLPSNAEKMPVVILGGGRVGKAVAETLEKRRIPYRIVEQKASVIPRGDSHYVLGSAADIAILKKAGIEETNTVVVTTHNDDLNIYLTIYCRKLRPDIQIISRSTLERNVASLYNAGATLVMSQAGMAANNIINILQPGRVYMLTEGLNIFKLKTPPVLAGKNLVESGIRMDTDCNVIAVRSKGKMVVPPDPEAPMAPDDELILVGTAGAEKQFMERYY